MGSTEIAPFLNVSMQVSARVLLTIIFNEKLQPTAIVCDLIMCGMFLLVRKDFCSQVALVQTLIITLDNQDKVAGVSH